MHTIKVDAVPLADRIASISRQLSTDGERSFYELLDKTQGKIGVVVSFVAILELIKRQLVGIVNTELESHPTTDNNDAEDSHIKPLTLQWLA